MIRGSNWRFIILISVLVAAFFIPPVKRTIGKAAFFIMRPILLSGTAAGDGIRSFSEYFSSIRSLIDENQALSRENLMLKERLVDYEGLVEENRTLRQSIRFVESTRRSRIATRIIGYSSDPAGLTFMIDGGERDGIAKGALVVSGERVLIGRVAKTEGGVSIVSALRNSGTTLSSVIIPRDVSVTVSPRKEVEGLFIGRGDAMAIDLVSNSADIRIGDLVTTNDFSELGYPGLIVGEVVSVKKSDTKLFLDVLVQELVPPERMRTVFVVGN